MLNDDVEIFGLAQFNCQTVFVIYAANGTGAGPIFFDGYLIRQPTQVDGALPVAPCCCQVPLGGEQDVNCATDLATVRYKYFNRPATLIFVASILKLLPIGRFRRRRVSAINGGIFKA
jgi:hypothetical protein